MYLRLYFTAIFGAENGFSDTYQHLDVSQHLPTYSICDADLSKLSLYLLPKDFKSVRSRYREAKCEVYSYLAQTRYFSYLLKYPICSSKYLLHAKVFFIKDAQII